MVFYFKLFNILHSAIKSYHNSFGKKQKQMQSNWNISAFRKSKKLLSNMFKYKVRTKQTEAKQRAGKYVYEIEFKIILELVTNFAWLAECLHMNRFAECS